MRPALVWLFGALVAALPAQQIVIPATAGREAVTAQRTGLVLPAGEFTVQELVDATATYLCRNFLYDANAVQRARGFALQRPLAVDALGAEELLYALLATRDFAVLPIDEPRGLYQIVLLDPQQPRADVLASSPWRTPEEVALRPRLREIVFTALPLQFADARDVAQALRQTTVLGPWRPGQLVASAADRQLLVLHGYRDQVANALQLAGRLERLLQSSAGKPADPVLARLRQLELELAALKQRLDGR